MGAVRPPAYPMPSMFDSLGVEVVDVMLRLAAGKLEGIDLADWLRRNSVASPAG